MHNISLSNFWAWCCISWVYEKQFCSKKNKLEKSTQCSNNKVKSYALITKHCLGYSCITKLKWSIDLNIQLGCFISFFCLIFRTTISSISEDWSLWYKKAACLTHALVVQIMSYCQHNLVNVLGRGIAPIPSNEQISFYLSIPFSNVIPFWALAGVFNRLAPRFLIWKRPALDEYRSDPQKPFLAMFLPSGYHRKFKISNFLV